MGNKPENVSVNPVFVANIMASLKCDGVGRIVNVGTLNQAYIMNYVHICKNYWSDFAICSLRIVLDDTCFLLVDA